MINYNCYGMCFVMGMICKRPFITQTDAMYQKLDS